jgi:hypothetical protein
VEKWHLSRRPLRGVGRRVDAPSIGSQQRERPRIASPPGSVQGSFSFMRVPASDDCATAHRGTALPMPLNPVPLTLKQKKLVRLACLLMIVGGIGFLTIGVGLSIGLADVVGALALVAGVAQVYVTNRAPTRDQKR